MCKGRKKVILVTGIVFTIMVVGIVGIVLLDRQKEEPRIKELRVELGGKLTNNIKDYFENEQQLIDLKEDLKWSWWLSIETDLIKKYNIPLKM